MRNKWAVAFFALSSLAFVASQAGALAQSTHSLPNITIALGSIRQTYHILTGFEMADADDAPLTLDLSDKDVARTFDSIAAQRPAYAWNFQDGVYDLYPQRQAEALSQLTVANLTLTNATLEEAQDALFSLPEVRGWLSQHRATRTRRAIAGSGLAAGPGGPFPQPKRISLSLSNVQLRTILNQMTTKFDRPQWIISHVAAKGEFSEDVSIQL